jgi:hypothetical protein
MMATSESLAPVLACSGVEITDENGGGFGAGSIGFLGYFGFGI